MNKHNTSWSARRRRLLGAGVSAGLLQASLLGDIGLEQAVAQPASSSFSLKVIHAASGGPLIRHFDPASLAALGTASRTTLVPWDKTERRWEGVTLKRLLEALQVAGRPIRVKALNDYVVVIPWQDIEQFDPLLAWLRDGSPIPVRAKGPLLVIYPFTQFPELRRAEYTDRSVWHVSEIVVE